MVQTKSSHIARKGPIIHIIKPTRRTGCSLGYICCPCLACLNAEFLKTVPGMIKLLEIIISGAIQYLLIAYGLKFHASLEWPFISALATSTVCFFTSSILLACYIVSEKSYTLIRSSLFEIVFNLIFCFLYISTTPYLAFFVDNILGPMLRGETLSEPMHFLLIPYVGTKLAMQIAYWGCGIAGVIYGVDLFFSFREYSRTKI